VCEQQTVATNEGTNKLFIHRVPACWIDSKIM